MWSPQTENFQKKRDFLKSSKLPGNEICAFHLPRLTLRVPGVLVGIRSWGNVCGIGIRTFQVLMRPIGPIYTRDG